MLAAVIPIYPELTYSIVKCEFVLYAAIVIIDIIKSRQFNLFHTWISAFVFIILSDMILCTASDPTNTYTIPSLFYLLGNNIVLFGYLFTTANDSRKPHYYTVKHPKYLLLFIILSIVLFIYFNTDQVVQTLAFGRILKDSTGSTTLLYTIVSALGSLLPAIIAYYFRYTAHRSVIYSLLCALPIFVIQFILATRFKILFQVLPFMIIIGMIRINWVTLRSMTTMIIAATLFGIASSYLVENRNMERGSTIYGESDYQEQHNDDVIYNMAQNMSPEGIMHMTAMANDYFKDHELSYGRECATMLYFWVPRSIWEEKPTQLDHWLIRKYENVSDAFSSASGFLGELRADFGWFALLFAFVIGIALKKSDVYIQRIISDNTPSFGIVFATILYPYFFFFVRSPLTASIHLIFTYLLYLIIRKLFMSRQDNTSQQEIFEDEQSND